LSASAKRAIGGRAIYDFWTMPPSVMQAWRQLAIDLAAKLSDNSCGGITWTQTLAAKAPSTRINNRTKPRQPIRTSFALR
jgi:hypothetical protein